MNATRDMFVGDRDVFRFLINQTDTIFFYNQTNTIFFYNQTDTAFFYNQTIQIDGDFDYNHTIEANISVFTVYNSDWSTTFNATYGAIDTDLIYNYTLADDFNYNETLIIRAADNVFSGENNFSELIRTDTIKSLGTEDMSILNNNSDKNLNFEVNDGGVQEIGIQINPLTDDVNIWKDLKINPDGFQGFGQVIQTAKEGSDAITNIYTMVKDRGGGNGGVGFGFRWLMQLENGGGARHDAANMEISWLDPTATSEDTLWEFNLMEAGSFVTPISLGNGLVNLTDTIITGELEITGNVTLDSNITQGGSITYWNGTCQITEIVSTGTKDILC